MAAVVSDTNPLTLTGGCHKSPLMFVTIKIMSLLTTLMLVAFVNPAELVTHNVSRFVPSASGRFSTQRTPLRSTSPLMVFTSPFVSVIVADTLAHGSSTKPRSVKLPPHNSIPFVGHVSDTTGFVAP